ncbi:MAG: N-acetylneuraminate synthase family protein [Deltaproteobacteria bacterium]
MSEIRIGNSLVGFGRPCCIVAEAGSNHDGDLSQALRLIDIAAEAGADAVKFQNFKADKLYPRSAGTAGYLQTSQSIHEVIRRMEVPEDWVPRLAAHCREKGIAFLSSPFDEDSADLLDPFLQAFKVASYEMTHHPLLRHIARKGKPMIVSTGTATLDEVLRSVEVIRSEGNDRIVLMQCTASYPCPLEAVNVRALVTLREATGLPTGLSDHSRDPIVAPMAAVALGAVMVEKHFTLRNSLPGPDHRFSLEPAELAEMVRRIREVERSLGHGRKERQEVEAELHAFARRTIFAIRPIAAGERLSPENIAILRCGRLGKGLEPAEFESVLGRRAKRPIASEEPIRREDLE